jgi:hypothetical protein
LVVFILNGFESGNEMKHRRKFLHLAAGVAALPVVSPPTLLARADEVIE